LILRDVRKDEVGVDIPSALEPEYLCGLADESVDLYRGPIEIVLANGLGTVKK
jgi:hypothetical protein